MKLEQLVDRVYADVKLLNPQITRDLVRKLAVTFKKEQGMNFHFRELAQHKIAQNDLNASLTVMVLDEPGLGGASHHYEIDAAGTPTTIKFQKGPVKEVGVNGVSIEALLAILIDRLEGFESGEFACADNAEALSHLRCALAALNRRTLDRLSRQVEGTLQK